MSGVSYVHVVPVLLAGRMRGACAIGCSFAWCLCYRLVVYVVHVLLAGRMRGACAIDCSDAPSCMLRHLFVCAMVPVKTPVRMRGAC